MRRTKLNCTISSSLGPSRVDDDRVGMLSCHPFKQIGMAPAKKGPLAHAAFAPCMGLRCTCWWTVGGLSCGDDGLKFVLPRVQHTTPKQVPPISVTDRNERSEPEA